MFKRAKVDGRDDDQLIDIGERLAPFVHADLELDQQERTVAAREVDRSIGGLHLAK